MIYLDHAAATPLDPRVAAVMQPFLTDQFYNPSALYQAARDVRSQLEAARADVAQVLGARPSEIVFTAGGTESDNLAIHGVMRRYPDGHLVTTSIEHDAVLAPARSYNCSVVAVQPDGQVEPRSVAAAITPSTVLVSVMQANNEIGTLQPIVKIAEIIRQERDRRRQAGESLPLYFHSDACQAANYLDLHVSRLGVDLLTLNGGKIYGPKQSGALYVRGGLVLDPLISGGGQERGLRSGTEAVAQAVGFAAALRMAQALRSSETRRLQAVQHAAFKLIAEQLPMAVINGARRQRLPNNIHFTIPGQDNERLLIQLDEAGIMAAAGSACSASSDTPSHVLRAIGLSDEDARASLRITMGRTTTIDDIAAAIDTIRQKVA